MKVLLFEELPVQVNRTYGSELLDSKYARDRAFKGLNLPQHKKISALCVDHPIAVHIHPILTSVEYQV
eukprot:m.282493 g.282493  ORF g.282493 m.282493 type:complete len:68 (+) comp16186_c0_seq15:2032-2235(+)